MNKMQLLFLGTSAAWPIPRLGCHCWICQSADPKDKRWRPSLLVNKILQIDAGLDFYHQYQKFKTSLANLKYIFLTHIHPDHYAGLWDAGKISHQPQIKVYVSEENKKILIKRYGSLIINFVFPKLTIFKAGKGIKINKNLSVTPFLIEHSTDTETYGFSFKEDDKHFVYLTDCRKIPSSSLKFCQKADLAVFDGSTFEPLGPDKAGHMPIKESLKLIKKLKIKKVYYTHIGHGPRMGTHQELEKKLQKLGGKNFYLAYDGLVLKI